MRSSLLVSFTLLAASALQAGPVFLELRPAVELRGNVVRVGDVAEVVSGSDPAVLAVELAQAPHPGRALRLTRARVRGTLASKGFDPNRVRLRGARSAVVTAEITRLDPLALRSLATRFLTDELARRYELAVPVRVSAPDEPWVVPIGRERSELHVRWRVAPGAEAPREALLEVVVTLDGVERAAQTLLGRVQLPEPEPTPEPQPASAQVAPAVTAAPARGTRRDPAAVVHQGQRVRTKVQVGALTVFGEGVATTDGALDGVIGVQVATGPVREARVTGPGSVEILGAGAPQ
ncbi:MAG: flagella basal body P-ring formation protein FlgA [Planctomycetota bacterium]